MILQRSIPGITESPRNITVDSGAIVSSLSYSAGVSPDVALCG